MQTWQLVLEYLRVFLSAPVIGGVVVSAALIGFRKQIRDLLDRGSRIKGPWGLEYEATQQVQTEAELPAPEEPLEQSTALQSSMGSGLTAGQMEMLRAAIHSLQEQARQWEFRYLNYFLARGTQLLLDWFAISPDGISRGQYYSLWSFTSSEQRDLMLQALLYHSLISSANDVYQITDKGRDYLVKRGPLPPLPPPSISRAAGIGRILMGAAATMKAEGKAEEPRKAVVVDTDTDVTR